MGWENRSLGCFVVPFLVVWAVIFSSQMWFMSVVAPAALSRWSREHGFEIEQQGTPVIPGGPYMWTAGPFRRVYRVTVRDRDGRRRRGWVRLGTNLWPSSAVDDCPVEVQWDT